MPCRISDDNFIENNPGGRSGDLYRFNDPEPGLSTTNYYSSARQNREVTGNRDLTGAISDVKNINNLKFNNRL